MASRPHQLLSEIINRHKQPFAIFIAEFYDHQPTCSFPQKTSIREIAAAYFTYCEATNINILQDTYSVGKIPLSIDDLVYMLINKDTYSTWGYLEYRRDGSGLDGNTLFISGLVLKKDPAIFKKSKKL